MESNNFEGVFCKKLEPLHHLERYIKVIPPQKPVIYNILPRPVYKHPVSVYVPSSKNAKLVRLSTRKPEFGDKSFQEPKFEKPVEVLEEIKIICEVILTALDFKIEFEVTVSERLKAIKSHTLKKLQAVLDENFCDFEILDEDLAIFYQKTSLCIDETLNLTEALKESSTTKWLIGNMLYLDARIVNPEKKLKLIKKIQIFSKPMEPREKLRLVVGLEKPNKKIGLRVILVSENPSEEKALLLKMKKINWKNILEFPLSSIYFVERVEIPKEPYFQKYADHLLVKVCFVTELQWEDMYLLFEQHDEFLKFLFFVIESSTIKRENSPKKSTTMDYSHIQRRRIDINRKEFQKGSLSLDDFVKQNKDIEFLKDAMSKYTKSLTETQA